MPVAVRAIFALSFASLLSPLLACQRAAVAERTSINMRQYAAAGPIRDSAHPALAFPTIDLFSPDGAFLYRAPTVGELEQWLARNPGQASGFSYPVDSLSDVSNRHPEFHLDPATLHGRYTVVFIDAENCHACSLQEQPFEQAEFRHHNINQVFVTLQLH